MVTGGKEPGMATCTLSIDGREVEVHEGMTVLGAARKVGAHIPTLCHLSAVNDIGACRVCVVELEGEERMCAACNTPVEDGMEVRTNSPKAVRARRKNLEMILSEHRSECTGCARNDTCALRALCADLAIRELPFRAQPPERSWDAKFPLQRDAGKCIKCMRCLSFCEKVQHCAVWDFAGTGPHMKVVVADGKSMERAGCALCGQCITHCPTGALTARRDIEAVFDALLDDEVETVVQVAPAVRAAWGEGVGLTREQATQGRMASALRALGFDHVYDTDFSADLTIMEEGSEVVETLRTRSVVPQEGSVNPADPYAGTVFTSCCPGWVRFAKQHYPAVVAHLSSAKSPHQMMGAVVKNTLGRDPGGVREDGRRVFCVSVMPCVAKKYECDVPVLRTQVGRDVDAVLTVREFDKMLRMFGVDCASLPESPFDDPLGISTGAGTIFGRTGGVMEAALRTAGYLVTGENPSFADCDCTDATPERPWVAKVLDLAGTQVRIAVASGLENTARLLDAMAAGHVAYDFVEVMACPGGCVGGGGQPIAFNRELAAERAELLNALDNADELRYSHENPQIQQLYRDWIGEPLSHTAHEWLHTDQAQWEL